MYVNYVKIPDCTRKNNRDFRRQLWKRIKGLLEVANAYVTCTADETKLWLSLMRLNYDWDTGYDYSSSCFNTLSNLGELSWS